MKASVKPGIPRPVIAAASQWRLDMPLPRKAVSEDAQRQVVTVAESILTRGAISYCSPSIELSLGSGDEVLGVEQLRDALTILGLKAIPDPESIAVDSADEAAFVSWLRDLAAKERLGINLTSQVYLSSIADGFENNKERCDFLLAYPNRSPIVVEVDGGQHAGQAMSDARRDELLSRAGVRTFRVPVEEVRRRAGPGLSALQEYLSDWGVPDDHEVLTSRLRLYKLAHQIQLAMLEAIRGGWLSLQTAGRLSIVLPDELRADDRWASLAIKAPSELRTLLSKLAQALAIELPETILDHVTIGGPGNVDLAVVINDSAGLSGVVAGAVFYVTDANLGVEIAAGVSASPPLKVSQPNRESTTWLLNYIFRKPYFREGQWEAIERVLQGKDAVVLLPTASGKSLVFQLSALLLPGRCIVVAPLISLIDDQIDDLRGFGIDRCVGITSAMTGIGRDEALRLFSSGHYLFSYIAPERFQRQSFREALRGLTAQAPVSVVAIDEAHCVSEWGHQFKTAYLNLGRTAREFCAFYGSAPPLAALTGTAGTLVLKDIQRELQITDFNAVITPGTFDRKELKYTVLHCGSSEKLNSVEGFLGLVASSFGISKGSLLGVHDERTYSGLVFCPHVNGEYGVMEYAARLSTLLQTPVDYYSGSAPSGMAVGWDRRKRDVVTAFKQNERPLLIATKAFGMGINKPNVRYTIHIGLPDSIESFYQEAGRAGRDGGIAQCGVILSDDNPQRTIHLLSPNISVEEIAKVVRETDRSEGDDVLRALWFHVNSFKGRLQDTEDIRQVTVLLGDLTRMRSVKLSWTDEQEKGKREKALHRLMLIGVVQDYTVDTQEFLVKLSGADQDKVAETYRNYVANFGTRPSEIEIGDAFSSSGGEAQAAILGMAGLLVEFIYDRIEKSRRSSLNEMFLAVSGARSGEELRQRIILHLEYSEWDELVKNVVDASHGGLAGLQPVLEKLNSPNEAAELRGAVARMLSSYPEHPGLHLLRAVSEALSRDVDWQVVENEFTAGLDGTLSKFDVGPEVAARACSQLLSVLDNSVDKRTDAGRVMTCILASPHVDEAFLRMLISVLPVELAGRPAAVLTVLLAQRASNLLAVT